MTGVPLGHWDKTVTTYQALKEAGVHLPRIQTVWYRAREFFGNQADRLSAEIATKRQTLAATVEKTASAVKTTMTATATSTTSYVYTNKSAKDRIHTPDLNEILTTNKLYLLQLKTDLGERSLLDNFLDNQLVEIALLSPTKTDSNSSTKAREIQSTMTALKNGMVAFKKNATQMSLTQATLFDPNADPTSLNSKDVMAAVKLLEHKKELEVSIESKQDFEAHVTLAKKTYTEEQQTEALQKFFATKTNKPSNMSQEDWAQLDNLAKACKKADSLEGKTLLLLAFRFQLVPEYDPGAKPTPLTKDATFATKMLTDITDIIKRSNKTYRPTI